MEYFFAVPTKTGINFGLISDNKQKTHALFQEITYFYNAAKIIIN